MHLLQKKGWICLILAKSSIVSCIAYGFMRSNSSQVECVVGGWPCVLACSVLYPCLRAEQLLVSVGAHGGRLRARVPAYPNTPKMPELASALATTNLPQIKAMLTQLR